MNFGDMILGLLWVVPALLMYALIRKTRNDYDP
jgi:hypothetical protein